MTKIGRFYTVDTPPPGQARMRAATDCGCSSRTRDDDSRVLVQAFPISPGVSYETATIGDQFFIYKRTSGGPQVKQTVSDAARKVSDMNRAAKSLWSDNV